MSIVSDIIVRWTPETSGRVTAIQVRSRIVGSTSWTEQAADQNPTTGEFRFSANAPSTDVEVQTRFRMSAGVYGAWTDNTIVTDGLTIYYASLSGLPTTLGQISPTEGSKLGGVETGATDGATSGKNLFDSTGTKLSDVQIITSQGTSANTNAVGGSPASTVNAGVQLANDIKNVTIPGINAAVDAAKTQASSDLASAKTTLDNARIAGDAGLQTSLNGIASTVGTNQATADSRYTALVNSDVTIGQRIDSVTADYTGRDTNTNARISNEATTRANGDSSLANSLNTLTSVAQPASINANSAFIVWPDGQVAPSYWNGWDYTGGAPNRVGGLNGRPYALNFNAAANVNSGVYQNISRGFGSFVVGCTVEADTYQGAGLYFASVNGATTINFSTEADSSGWVSVGGGYYRRTFTKLYTSPIDGAINNWTLYTMANWDGFGARAAKNITFHEVWARPATAAEIAGQRADANANTALAQISNESSTRADQVSSLASTSSSIRADLNSWNNDRYNQANAVNARVDSAYTAIANGDGAIASRVDSLTATVNGNSASISSQAGAIADYYGRTRAFVAWTANAGNGRAQLALYADQNGRGGVDIVGDVSISGDLLVGGTVSTGKVQDSAITKQYFAGLGQEVVGDGNAANYCVVYFHLDYPADIILIATGSQNYYGYVPDYQSSVYLDVSMVPVLQVARASMSPRGR